MKKLRFVLWFLLGLSLLWLQGCGSKAVQYELMPALVKNRPAIIFVPGFYGTALADENGDRLFLNTTGALFGNIPLALETPDLGIEGARKLHTDGILEKINFAPFMSRNVYGEAMNYLRETFGAQAEIVPFAYDWRQSLIATVRELDAIVKRLEAAHASSIQIVAHSMGGLIVSYYLRYGTQDPQTALENGEGAKHVSAVVLAGTPFAGSTTAFRNLQTGTSLGMAKTPLNQLSLSTFPSMYQLMPAPDATGLYNYALEPSTENLYSEEVWSKRAWGLMKERYADPIYLARRQKATKQYLTAAEQYWKKLRAPASIKSTLPILLLIGRGYQTLGKVVWTGSGLNEGGRLLDEDNLVREKFPTRSIASLNEDGDGAVTLPSAEPPAGITQTFRVQVVRHRIGHEEMFADENFLKGTTEFLRKAWRKN